MPQAAEAALTGLLIFAAAVWIGGYVAIAVVARVVRRTLDPPARVALFRGLGRAYGVIGLCALALAYGCGAVLVYGRPWDALLTATAVVAAALVAATATGIAQARRMTRMRRRALEGNGAVADGIRRSAGRAGALRALIGLLSLALLALGVLLGA